MDKNKFKYCTLLLIDDYNHSKIFISPKNKYYIRDDNKSIDVKILNKFKDIRKFNEINVSVEDITNNYYKINKSCIIRHCTILSIDDNNHNRIFISENIYTILPMLMMIIRIIMMMIMMMIIMMMMMMMMLN